MAKKNKTDELRPLSAWEYVGYDILYSLPVIGLVFMIIFAVDGSNINRRNFSRSFLIFYLLSLIFMTVMVSSGFLLGIVEGVMGK